MCALSLFSLAERHGKRTRRPQFYLGPAGSGSPHHFHGAAINALASGGVCLSPRRPSILTFQSGKTSQSLVWPHTRTRVTRNVAQAYGRKLWALSPPWRARYSAFPALAAFAAEPSDGLLACEQRAGDVLYVPNNWGHAVLNLQTSIGVAAEITFITP